MTSRALESVERVLAAGGEPDDVLRAAVATLTEEPEIAWAAIAFLEEGELTLGPSAGEPDEARRRRVPISYQGDPVGELWADGEVDETMLDAIARLVAVHVLLGWDTDGEVWEP